jgi:hypothetical protein
MATPHHDNGADFMPKKPAHPTNLLNEALRLHRDGKLDQAALRYVLILRTNPNSVDALHLLGALRSRQGRHAEGLDHIRAALKLNSANASALCDLGSILLKLSRPQDALASYDKALAIKPDHVEALYNRGNALRDRRSAAFNPEEPRSGSALDLPSGTIVEELGAEFDSGRDAFIDAPAVMSCLDLIMTSDTSITHLAGAFARPVWVALKHVPDWRWMLDRPDSPWYPTTKLYRQSVRDDWDGVFERLAADVAKLTATAEPGSISSCCDGADMPQAARQDVNTKRRMGSPSER